MKWEDRQPSQNVEDRRERPGLETALAGILESTFGKPDESWRAELRQQLDGAQAEIDAALDELRASGADAAAVARASGQAQYLVQLQRQLTDAPPAQAASLKSAISTAVAASASLSTQSREIAAFYKTGEVLSLAETTAAARRDVERISNEIYEQRIFDPYLQFESAEAEAEYRRREAENKRYIEAELAKDTPEGALNAAGGMQDQMLDAAANGADQSPELRERWNALKETARAQRDALRAEGKFTEEYDKRIEDSVRRFLRSKGKTDAEIDAILAASADPLDAVEPYLESEKDAHSLDKVVGDAASLSAKPAPVKYDDAPVAESKEAKPDDIFAQFQNTGVQFTGDGSGHGLNGGKSRDREGPPLPP